jgi:hypothetical protein
MIRIVFMTSLASLFSVAAVNCAAAQLDCSSRDIACTANCQTLPPELSVGCQTYCFEDREECDRTVERAWLNERVLLEELLTCAVTVTQKCDRASERPKHSPACQDS